MICKITTIKDILFLKNKTVSILFFVIAISFYNCYSQDVENERVKRLQRSIYIFNFAQQVDWGHIDDLEVFKIGVLGPDQTILDLKSMALKRKIAGKQVEVVRYQKVKNIRDIQLLYVNHKFNYDINYILQKISGKRILLISEDYNYDISMINMVNVGDSYEYEINVAKLKNEGFIIASSLKQHAITSSQKWKELFRSTKQSLEKTQEKNKTIIEDKEDQIKQQQQQIISQEKSIDTIQNRIYQDNKLLSKLWSETEIRKKKYEEKVLIERALEKKIKEQLQFIKIQEDKIKNRNQEIENQKSYLEQQNNEIHDKIIKLKEQNKEIDRQKKINLLLIVVLLLILISSFFIYRGYILKKKLNAQLEEKNKEIYLQSTELASKNEELEQFAYIASHDLQEPLNTISSFIGLIKEDYGDSFDTTGKESLNFIEEASIRMKKLIDGLLEYSRLGRSHNKSLVNLDTIVDELLADLATVIEKTQAKISVDTLPIVKGSEIELRLLIQNLISNAIKFIDKGMIPEVKISVVEKTKKEDSLAKLWEFSVADNGIGIPAKHQDRIFSIFQRLHSRDKYKGTGIGLAHCKKIVESHGGQIWLRSKEGRGTTFYFTIPH